jgi:uncharacterized membrane protein YdjX (TVP38/TMEM64 family)
MPQGPAEATAPGVGARSGRIPLRRIGLGIVAVVALIILGRQVGAYVPQFVVWVNSLGVWGPLVFIIGYAVATVAFVPGSILTLAAGAVFGLGKGVLYVFIAAVLGSSAAFLVSRHLARAVIDQAVSAQGRKIVFLLRLSPVFPFNLLNYALGLTNVRFIDYLVASVGMLPGTFLYVYYGKLAGDVAALAGGAAVKKDATYYAVLVLGLAATVLVTALVTRIARRALRDVTAE